jgi:dTDP-4-dehydrorhamnose 3,5-epimerase
MKFLPTRLPGVVLIEPEMHGDQRGFFMETWHARKFAAAGIDATFVQDNHSRSTQGTLRGLHLQVRQPQGKLIRVVAGEIFDVAVDLRRDSPTFRRWVGFTLSAANRHQLWVPPGFAHGFYTLSAIAEIIYKCTDFYAPEHERTLRWDDPELAIHWPLTADRPPILSAKDAAGITLRDLVASL